MTFKTLDDITDLAGKRVLVRVDLNVPMDNYKVTDTTRIERVLPTIKELSEKGAKVILLAHFGRPKGEKVKEMSLAPVARAVSDLLGKTVGFVEDCIGPSAAGAVAVMQNGQVLLMENTRFHKGEEKNDPEFAKALAANGDIYVNDAFSAAHRAHGSTEGIAQLLAGICRPHDAGRASSTRLRAW
jgi:phosphoglycerate kinase